MLSLYLFMTVSPHLQSGIQCYGFLVIFFNHLSLNTSLENSVITHIFLWLAGLDLHAHLGGAGRGASCESLDSDGDRASLRVGGCNQTKLWLYLPWGVENRSLMSKSYRYSSVRNKDFQVN